MPSIAANRERAVRGILAALLVAGAIGLAAVAWMPRERIHTMLAARAPDGSVSAAYVDDVRHRAGLCALGLLVVAIGVAMFPLPVSIREPRPSFDAAAAGIVAIGAIARAMLLTRPLHYDEAFTLTEFASRSPLFFLTRYTHPNNHVFHTLLVWITTHVFGDALWAARLPAFLAGVAAIGATYVVALRLHERRTALIAAALVAGATPLVEFSAQARGYTILVLCVLLLYAAPSRPLRAGLLIAIAAWTIPVTAYAAAGYLIWLVRRDRESAWKTACIAAAGTFVFYVPIVVVSGLASITANGNVLPVPFDVFFVKLPQSLCEMWREWSLSFTMPGMIALAIAAAARRRINASAAILLTSVLTIAALLLLTRRVPFARVWIFLLPLYLIVAASGLASVIPPRFAAAVAIVLAALTAANAVRLTARDTFFEDPAFADAKAIAAAAARSDATILVIGPLDAPLAYELPRAGVPPLRVIVDRFDSDLVAVHAAINAAPHLRAIVSDKPEAQERWRSLGIAGARPVQRFTGATLLEVRP